MLEMLKKRATEAHIENIEYVNSELETIPIDDHSIDKVLIAFVIHEVPSIVNTLNEIKRILKPGGTVMVIEWEAVETEDGPPLHERFASKELMKVLQDHGFEAMSSAQCHQLCRYGHHQLIQRRDRKQLMKF